MDTEDSPVPTNDTNFLGVNLNFTNAKNVFAIYFSGLIILAYALSIFVSILHLRKESVVCSLTRPDPSVYFSEYIILIRTSQMIGSSLDYRGRIHIQLKGTFSDTAKLHLKKGKGIIYFFERGTTNIFVYHSPSVLGDIKVVEFYLVNDAPNEIPYVEWRPEYLSVLHPTTKKQWGSVIDRKIRCSNVLTEIIECKDNTIDRHSILKTFCTFHIGLSLFNCPLRLGMYNNLVNVVMIFFITCGLMLTSLFIELAIKDSNNKSTVAILGRKSYGFIIPVFGMWILELFVEAIFRNTVPRVSTSDYSMFQGLMKPVPYQFGVQDFVVNYNWQKVRLLMPQMSVIIPFGSRHQGAQAIFSVEPVRSYFNFHGHLNLKVERCGNWYLRSMSICALPLPQSIRWLAREARSRKEDILVQQYISNFTSPVCYFCCWLIDLPSTLEEPYQMGLIISHIICTDILSLSKLKNKEYCARLAQICAHQWHGMIAHVFIHVVKQSMEYRGQILSGVRDFIYRTINKFGKRNAREIQATWRKRQINLTEIKLKKSKEVPTEQLEDINESATLVHSKRYFTIERALWNIICRNNKGEDKSSDAFIMSQNFQDMDFNDFEEDFLEFDKSSTGNDSQCLQTEKDVSTKIYGGSAPKTWATNYKVMPKFSIVKEDKIKCRSKGKLLKKPGAIRRRPLVNPMSQYETEDGSIKLANARGDTNADTDCKMNAVEMFNIVSEKCDFPSNSKNDSDMKMSAVIGHHEQDTNWNAEADAYVPYSIEKHHENTALVQMIVEQKKLEKRGFGEEWSSLPIATYEETRLGPPFDDSYAMEVDPNNRFCALRHADEMLAHSCNRAHCKANTDIHKMVGGPSLDVLKRLLKDKLHFALDSDHIVDIKKLWIRKKMILNMFEIMNEKAELYDSERFKTSNNPGYNGKACNQAFTGILATLEVLVDVTVNINQVDDFTQGGKLLSHDNLEARCVYCAKFLSAGITTNNKGCYNLEILVRFFKNSTITVAEKEINIEFAHKYTIQRFCAMIVSNAMKEVAFELEDPPLVMACKITRAMICKLIHGMLPKVITFKNMTADDLRRLGKRTERIQARHDTSLGKSKKETEAEKRKKRILAKLDELLINKWKMAAKENELEYCAGLLAQILVHEKMMGFAVYTGFILKEHENIINGSLTHLIEIERKSYSAVLKIARYMMYPILMRALDTSLSLDVLFRSVEAETTYILEEICVSQMNSEPTFLKTCCYYIEDIIYQKVEEFKSFFLYLNDFVPIDELQTEIKPNLYKCTFKFNGKIKLSVANYHSSIASPLRRWGRSAVQGIAIPRELKNRNVSKTDFKEMLPFIIETCTNENRLIVAKLLNTRLKMIAFMDVQNSKKNKELRMHLAQVQGHLLEQVALSAQSVTNTFSIDTDFQREFSKDDLFNVEFYATRNMKLFFPTNAGLILLMLLIIVTLGMTMFIMLKAGILTIEEVKGWFFKLVNSLLVYSLLFEPLKCLIYYILQLYAR